MIRTFEILEELETHGQKKKIKQEILTANKDNESLREICKLAYDWLTPYYVTDVVGFTCQHEVPSTDDVAKIRFIVFKQLLRRLHERTLSGHAARDALTSFFNTISELEAKWYRRVIKRDFRLHFGARTLKKVWPDIVSTYAVQLATKVEDSAKLSWPLLAEPKYDGFRLTIPCKDGTGSCFTRNGRKKENLQFFADRVAKILVDGVLDVEIYHESWNTVAKVVNTKPENMTAEKKEMLNQCKLWAFDLIALEPFLAGKDTTTLKVRRKKLEKLLTETPIEGVALVPQHEVSDYDSAIELYDKYVDQGYEGIMLKVPDSPYEGKRTKSWLKIKPEETVDAKIVAYEEGTGKNEGRLGAFTVELDDGTRVRVGGGYSDKQRDKFGPDMIGKMLEFGRQKEKAGAEVATSRFPQFKRMRPDKDE